MEQETTGVMLYCMLVARFAKVGLLLLFARTLAMFLTCFAEVPVHLHQLHLQLLAG